jgi:gluconolactonase
MQQMYAAPPELTTETFTQIPEDLRYRGSPNLWVQHTRPGVRLHSFLEGPSFDRDGHLYCVDVPYGRIFRITPDGEWSVAAEYHGEPNGLKIHKDGRIFIADHLHGIMVMDPENGKIEPVSTRANLERFRGCNDLFFAGNGDLYFTDPGRSSLSNPTGRLFVLRANGVLELLLNNIPYPNGLVMNPEETCLYLAVSRANCIWRVSLNAGPMGRMVGLFIQLSGGLAGPDGLAMDEESNLAVAHSQHGTIWLFSKYGEPLYRIRSCAGKSMTNLAYGGPDRKTLYVTEAETGSILTARMKVPGRLMYSHM